MDLFPKDPDQNSNPETMSNSFNRSHFVPVHSFVHLIQIEPTLQSSSLDIDWLREITTNNPQAIRHEKIGGQIILTASTKELQAFLLKHLKTKGAFKAMGNLQREAETTVPPKSPGRLGTEGR